MPIYEYRCQDCGSKFEVLVRGHETPKCPKCAGTSLKKLISGFNSNCAGGKSSCGTCAGGTCGTCGK